MKPVLYKGLSRRERVKARLAYIAHQGGKCYYCRGDINAQPPEAVLRKRINKKLFPPNFFKYPVHLHHCHKTGLTAGAVHNYCNAVLWQCHGK